MMIGHDVNWRPDATVEALLAAVHGARVARPRVGGGTALLFDAQGPGGASTVMIECPWRFEQSGRVEFGWDSPLEELPSLVQAVAGLRTEHVRVHSPLLDASIEFEGGSRIRMFVVGNAEAETGWTLFLPEQLAVVAEAGRPLTIEQ